MEPNTPRIRVGDPAGAVSELARQADRLLGARDELTNLVGTAESADGFIRATAGPEGLRELVLEPKAMRLPAADLAEQIVRLVRDASADLARARREKYDELGVDAPHVDPAEARAKLAELDALARAGDGDMIAVYERFRRQIGL